jgi:hypothetical protein
MEWRGQVSGVLNTQEPLHDSEDVEQRGKSRQHRSRYCRSQ